jgi:nitrate reductase NapAB chaperone NapD
MRWVLFAVIGIPLISATSCAVHSSSQSFHVWQVKGAVAAVDASSIRVRHKSGQVVVVLIDERTTYVHNKQPASKDLLIKGTRVIVEVERRGAVDHALRVEIFEGARRSSA